MMQNFDTNEIFLLQPTLKRDRHLFYQLKHTTWQHMVTYTQIVHVYFTDTALNMI